MKVFQLSVVLLLSCFSVVKSQDVTKKIKLFDGKTLKGWEGDTNKTWRVENGAITGGSLSETVPHNQFIKTDKTYGNYTLKLKFKLNGTEGFINGGVQFHSQRISNPDFEMIGYQADIGDGYWASLYDESRRNKLLAIADSAKVERLLRRNQWNDYEVRTKGRRIQIFLNGEQTIDYTETDEQIPQSGYIAFQVHGGGKALVAYKDIFLMPAPKK